MNPLHLIGPDFLVFYGVFAVFVLVTAWAFLRAVEDESHEPDPIVPLDDPYEIAVLRGGPEEAARVAVVSLASAPVVASSATRTAKQRASDWVTATRRPSSRSTARALRSPPPGSLAATAIA